MTAGEDQLQPLVSDFGVIELVHGHLRDVEQSCLLRKRALAPDPVDRPVPGNRGEPGNRVDRDALALPALRRDRERLLSGLLGNVEVAKEADQRGQNATPVFTEDVLEGYRSTTGRTSTAPPSRAAGMRPATSIAWSRFSASNTK